MTRKRSSPMGLEILLPVLLAFIMLPLLTQAAPLQDYTEIQQYTEGCYYNYNHYNEGDRIMTNEPCLNCTCHNKMLMCYLRVCPFTKPIGHDCIVEKREDQCCPIITCPEVPVDVAHAAPEPGTELSFPEKFGCSIDGKFYLEGAQVPSNPNKPCELCYCIKNRTSCLMQECTLHIDGCTPIYNKGSCCPVRYNCDHENDVLELEDHSSSTEVATTTTQRPTTGFILTSTMTPAVSTDCVHNKAVYADGARIPGETACENCYCMRGDIVCAVQECHMPMLNGKEKLCHPMPAAEGECCPSNYVCEDDKTTQTVEATTLPYHTLDEENKISTTAPVKDLHSAIPEEDLQLQAHIDDEETATKTSPAEEDKETETISVRKPIDAENPETDTEKESTTKSNEYAETTAIPSSVFKSDESKEVVTAAPKLSDNLPESTTEPLSLAQDADQTTQSVTKSEYLDEKDEKEITTRVPIATSELSEISTDSAAASEEHTTPLSVENIPDTEKFITTVSAADVEDQQVTELTPTEEKTPEKSTESVEKIESVAAEETSTKMEDRIAVTEVAEKEINPLESDDSVTETSEEEKKPIEYTTKASLEIESTTAEAEKDHQTKVSTSAAVTEEDEQSTETSTEVQEEVEEDKPEIHDISIAKETSEATTQVPDAIRLEEIDFTTEKPKTEEDRDAEKEAETEQTTEFSKRKEPAVTTEAAVESDEDEIVTKLPTSVDEKPSTTSLPKMEDTEEDEGVSTTSLPTRIDSVPSKEESELLEETKPSSSAEEKLNITTGAPIVTDEHTTLGEDKQHIFDDELGSGDDKAEVSTENVSEITHTYGQEPIAAVDGKPAEETGSDEVSGESAESTESEEDNKLLDLTTAKPSLTDATTPADGKLENGAEQLETTTTKHTIPAEEVTETQEKDIEAEQKPSEDIDLKETSTELTETQEKDIAAEQKPSEDIDLKETTTELTEKQEKDIAAEQKPSEDIDLKGTTTELTETQEKDIESEQKPSEDIDIKETTTLSTLSEEKLPTDSQEPVDKHEETESTDRPEIIEDHTQKQQSELESDKKQYVTEILEELEHSTTQKPLDERDQQTTTAHAITTTSVGEHDGEKDLSENDADESKTTDSPLIIAEDKTDFTTAYPNKQIDVKKEDSMEAEKPTLDSKADFEDKTSTTIKPFVEPSYVEEVPDMHLPPFIPGEGDCLVEQKTYKNNSIVPTSDECEVVCKCVSSIIVCEHIKCDVPENVEKCILDESSENKCCPTYICNAVDTPAKEEESIDTEEHDIIQHPATAATEHAETTGKPTSSGIIPGMSIPEIEMPTVFTEEPMSHVKDEDEVELQTTKQPAVAMADEKHDVLVEDKHPSTTASAVPEDMIVPQSMGPVESHKQENPEMVTEEQISHMVPGSAAETEHAVIKEQSHKEVDEKTTVVYEFVESSTAPSVHLPSDEKQENEIKTSSSTPSTDDYQTVKPYEEEGSGYIEAQTEMPTSSTADEISTPTKSTEEPETIHFDLSTEEDGKPDVQTDKEVTVESTEEPKLTHVSHDDEKTETQTAYLNLSTETPTISADMTTSGEIQKESQSQPTTPAYGMSTESEQDEPAATNVYNKDTIDSTTAAIPEKHDTGADEEPITYTTAIPSMNVSEKETSTKTQTTEEIKDADIALEESFSTVASVTEHAAEEEVAEKHDNEIVKPIEEDQEIELSTVVSETERVSTISPVTTAEVEHSEHTAAPDQHKEASTGPSFTTYQPETQTSTTHIDDHHIDAASEEHEEEKESSSTPVFEDKPSVSSTPSIPDGTKIVTEKPMETEISTINPSFDDEVLQISTTVSADVEESSEGEEKIHQLHTEGSGEQETESEQTTRIPAVYISTTEQIKKESTTMSSLEGAEDATHIPMDHSVATATEDEELITKTSNALEDQSTISPQISEQTTRITLSEKDLTSVIKDETTGEPEHSKTNEQTTTTPDYTVAVTHVPAKQPSPEEGSGESEQTTSAPDYTIPVTHVPAKHPSHEEGSKESEQTTSAPDYTIPVTHVPAKHPSHEEGSGELVASEADVTTEAASMHEINEIVTQRVEEEDEASGEDSEADDKMMQTTERQHSEILITTELPKISDEKELNEAPTDHISIDDEKPISETTISPESMHEQATDKYYIPSGTKAPFDELPIDQSANKDKVSPASEEELSSELESTEEPKEIGTITGVEDQTQSIEDQNMLLVTQAPTESGEKDVSKTTYAPLSDDDVDAQTVKNLKEEDIQDEDIDHLTEQPVKTSLTSDEPQHITAKYPIDDVNASAPTKSSISLEDSELSTTQTLDEEKSKEPEIIESVTAKLPSDETLAETTEHIPFHKIEENKEELPTKEVKIPDIDILSSTSAPIESSDLMTTTPSAENEDNLTVTKFVEVIDKEIVSTKSPGHDEDVFVAAVTQQPIETKDEQGSDEIADKTTAVPTTPHSPITGFTAESTTQSEEDAELHVLPDSSTVKLPEMIEETTELSAEKSETEKDKPLEETSQAEKDSADKLHEALPEVTTELTVEANVPTELSEKTTELPAEDAVTDADVSHTRTTEVPIGQTSDELPQQPSETPAVVTSVNLQEQDFDEATKEPHAKEEESIEQTTRLPEYTHISTENVAQDVTTASVQDMEEEEESIDLHKEAEVTTNKLEEDSSELPIQTPDEDVKEADEKQLTEHEIQQLGDAHKTTESLTDHTTELPTKDKQTEEEEEHESDDKTSEHTTVTAAVGAESEDTFEKHEDLDEEPHEKSTELPVGAYDHSSTTKIAEVTTESTIREEDEEEALQETSPETMEGISAVKLHTSTTTHPLFAIHSTLSSAAIDSRIDDTTSHSTSSPAKSEETSTASITSTVSSTTTEPITTSGPHYQPPPPIYGQTPQYGPTQYEDEYTDEDEGEVFGPGTCRYGGKLYVSAQQIPRDDPCDFCFCFRSDIICLQQSCPPPIAGCHEEPISGFCCPRYECPVSMATVLNITTSTTTTSTTLPPHFLHHNYGTNAQRNGCLINGRSYRVGEKIESTSGPCINCTCGGDGKMKCDPQACVPEPTMQQVMAVVAAGRKR